MKCPRCFGGPVTCICINKPKENEVSNLPGNPDYDNAKLALASTVLSADDDAATIQSILIDNASATLALAYEQRTANLIQYIKIIDDTDRETMRVIKSRLGLGD